MTFFELEKGQLNQEILKILADEEQQNLEIEKDVIQMREAVIRGGFQALVDYTAKFDHFDLTEANFTVSEQEIDDLAQKIKPQIADSLEIAIERIKAFHMKQKELSFSFQDDDLNQMGQKVIALDSVAVYVPGGQALYPSTFYMTVIPALIAGVKRIVVLTPPRTFQESPEVARLIQLLGIKEIYRGCGTALVLGAVYGAGPLARVDKIVGPGNEYIAKAKQLSYGKIDIDMIAGPSEILVIADTTDEKDIAIIAADLLSQAEHGPAGFTKSIVVGCHKNYLLKIKEEVYRQAQSLPNQASVIKSLQNRGLVICCADLEECAAVSNQLAPEHLEIFSGQPYPILDLIRHAGSVFLGKYTPESVGDYIGGPNHVLPTSQTARFFSPLGVYDFQKRLSWIEFNRSSLFKYKDNITAIARSEYLEAHARSVEARFK